MPYMSRFFIGTGHIRDMYEICAAQVRDFTEAGTKMNRSRYNPGQPINNIQVNKKKGGSWKGKCSFLPPKRIGIKDTIYYRIQQPLPGSQFLVLCFKAALPRWGVLLEACSLQLEAALPRRSVLLSAFSFQPVFACSLQLEACSLLFVFLSALCPLPSCPYQKKLSWKQSTYVTNNLNPIHITRVRQKVIQSATNTKVSRYLLNI